MYSYLGLVLNIIHSFIAEVPYIIPLFSALRHSSVVRLVLVLHRSIVYHTFYTVYRVPLLKVGIVTPSDHVTAVMNSSSIVNINSLPV